MSRFRSHRRWSAIPMALIVLLRSAAVAAQEPSSPATANKVTPLGYVETYYDFNFRRPSNNINNFRGYDNRSETFSITNAVLGVAWAAGDVSGRVVFQVGSTASTEYLGEPVLPGTPSVNATGPAVWSLIQEAYVTYKVSALKGLSLQAGIFLAPIGPESLAVKDNWNWSRSNLFFGLWSYETGARAAYDLNDDFTFGLGLYNGWNSVVDNNRYKSLQATVQYHAGTKLAAQLLYWGGVERATGAPEGSGWRNDFDLFATWFALDWLALQGHFNAGFEDNTFGTSSWFAGALYGRLHPFSWLFAAVRGDRFWENVASNTIGRAGPLFWGGASWVTEITASLQVSPPGPVTAFVEYRHDQADIPLYFNSNVSGSGTPADPFLPNTKAQDTLTVGATTWF